MLWEKVLWVLGEALSGARKGYRCSPGIRTVPIYPPILSKPPMRVL